MPTATEAYSTQASTAAPAADYSESGQTNEYRYNALLAQYPDSPVETYYCDGVQEALFNGSPTEDGKNGAFYLLRYTDTELWEGKYGSGQGVVSTFGLGYGYCEWFFSSMSGFTITWYPNWCDDGVCYEFSGCSLTSELPELPDDIP